MASEYTPTNVTQGFGAETTINQNFNDIKAAMDKMLSRLPTTDNAMGQALDMGGNRLINLANGVAATDPVLFGQVSSLILGTATGNLTYDDALNIDSDTFTMVKVTLTGNPTITFTGSPQDGQPVLLALKQDGTGSRLVTWESRVRFSSDLPSVALSLGANKLDYILLRYNTDADKFDLIAINKGF